MSSTEGIVDVQVSIGSHLWRGGEAAYKQELKYLDYTSESTLPSAAHLLAELGVVLLLLLVEAHVLQQDQLREARGEG